MANIRIDLDNTLCKTDGTNYEESTPRSEQIKKINILYNQGHMIIIETGRHWNHMELTFNQLKKWGVMHHSLIMGKVPGYLIDDMSMKIEDLNMEAFIK